MMIHILLWLFGETIIAAGCNLPAWLRLSIIGLRDRSVSRASRVTRLALVATSAGLIFGSYGRLGMAIKRPDMLEQPIALIVPWSIHSTGTHLTFNAVDSPPFATAIWMGLLFTGELGMLAGSHYALKSAGMRHPHTWALIVLSAAWTLLVFVGGLS